MNGNIPILSDTTYRIESELGSGGGGVVYKAWHTRLQKYVVLKELKHSKQSDINTQRNEAEALKNVKSAYLPQVFDFLTEGGRTFTVIEFVEGESLDKLLERGVIFSQPQVVKWYGQLVSALEAIHKQDIYHRDIKPANIMLTPSGDVCLIDFNAALVSGNDVRLISRSLGYASPEQYSIYEYYRNTYAQSPVNLGTSGVRDMPDVGSVTDIIAQSNASLSNDSQQTENYNAYEGAGGTDAILPRDALAMERMHSDIYSDETEAIVPRDVFAIDWMRSDIYSLGATMYHLLTGVRPPERALEVVPISRIGHFSEGIVYVIEKSIQLNPAERFVSANILAAAVQNIHKHDSRWKNSQIRKLVASIVLIAAFAAFLISSFAGHTIMAQEREAHFYETVYNIQISDAPQIYFDQALDIFWDRIDPYFAMAMRLWNDGDIIATRDFIEANLGNIAKFQSVPEATRMLGDIYFILGNTYYFQPGEPNYQLARGNFEVALRFITDNPVIYRDYAIALARTGDIDRAEQAVRVARSLDLETDSLHLLYGEINFAKRDFEYALDSFAQVISVTTDGYLLYRALHTSDEIFRILGQPERSTMLLSENLNRLPINRVPEITERLADAYVRAGDYDGALALFEQLAETGPPQFHLFHGLAILLQNTGELERAAGVLARMADFFPNDYRVPMRKAFLEAEIQSRIENEYRDYSRTLYYYENAAALYEEHVRPGDADPEMQQLSMIIEQLHAHGWLD